MHSRTTLFALFTSILCLFLTHNSAAQITLNGLKNKASNAMENALEKKIEAEMNKAAQRMVDKYWERVLGNYYSDLYSDGSSMGASSGSPRAFPFVIDENVEIEEQYTFNHSVRMRVDTYKKNGKLDETAFMVSHSNHDHAYLGTEIENEDGKKGGDIFIINDFENNALIMLMESEGQKMRLAYSFKFDESAAEQMVTEEDVDELEEITTQEEITTKTYAFETIGTKDILGYPCKGYRQDRDDMMVEVWLAHEDVFGMNTMFGAAGMNNENRDKMIADGYPQGSIMEVSSTDKDSNEKTTMTVVEIDDNIDITMRMEDYPSSAELHAETEGGSED